MLDEIQYWDATQRGDSYWFFTKDRKQADVVQTLAHIADRRASVIEHEQSEGSYSDTLMYFVNIMRGSTANVSGKHWKRQDYTGKVYCIKVPSTYFLVRQNETISVTGNCNLQTIPSEKSKSVGKAKARGAIAGLGEAYQYPDLRSIFVPDTGYTFFNGDLDRADLQVVCWEADDELLKSAMRLGVDIHLMNVFTLDGKDPPPLEELVEGHPRYLDHRGPRKLSREFSKVFCHGTNYGGGARTMAVNTGRTVAEVDRAQQIWFGAHPGIKRWHDKVKAQVTKYRFVENTFGYRWYIFDRPDSIIPEAIAWIPQSTVSIVINRIWQRIYRDLPEVQILLQVHDSIAGQMPTAQSSTLASDIVERSRVVVPYPDPLIIPFSLGLSTSHWGAC